MTPVADPVRDRGERNSAEEHEAEHARAEAASNEYVLNVAFASFLGFTVLQFMFALGARSQALMADCAAMAVDAVTYLFNYCAERLKHQETDDTEKGLPLDVIHRRRKLHRLYLELIPPLISVTTLALVTILALKSAFKVLLDDTEVKNPPDVTIMLIFSGINLVIDVLNVTCFARTEDHFSFLPSSWFGTSVERNAGEACSERSSLLNNKASDEENGTAMTGSSATEGATTQSDDHQRDPDSHELNLNMCSAWTHVCADTLRSIATLAAAGISTLFPEFLSPSDADSFGAIIISIIIIISLGPLVHGLWCTALEIVAIVRKPGDSNRFGGLISS